MISIARLKAVKKTSLSGLLFFVFGIFSPVLISSTVDAYSGSGSGASGDPFIITSCNQFKEIDSAPSAYYSLANDIDCSSEHNSMIAAIPFSGNLDGNNHSISIGLEAYPSSLGLFSTIDGGTVIDLVLAGSVDAGNGVPAGATGALAGVINNGSHLTHITSSVLVSGRASPMGGIAGVIYNSSVTGVINNGSVTSNMGTVGGLFGGAYCGTLITDSHMSGDVSGNGDRAGGIAGEDGCEGPGSTYADVYVTGTVSSDGDLVGGIVGEGYSTSISQAHSTGYIEGIARVGGVAGQLNYDSSITQSYSTGEILGYGDRVGGVIGDLAGDTALTQSYSTSTVTTSGSYGGGLVGILDGGSVDNSYARGAVHGEAVGGLVGYAWSGSIGHSYSTGMVDTENENHGGLAALKMIEGDNGLFWDTETSVPTSAFGHGKTTAEMKDIATYTSTATPGLGLSIWDFAGNQNDDSGTDEIWSIFPNANDGYPCLSWQETCTDTPTSPDSDGDGMSDAEEDAGPNNGDANNDGTPDKDQDNVVALLNETSNKYGVLQLSQSCEIQTAEFGMTSSLPTSDSSYSYPYGMFNFVADCGGTGQTFTVTQFYYGADPSDFTMRKYNLNNHQYSTVSNVIYGTLDNAVVAQYDVTDGGELDQDGVADGTIHDPAGIALPITNSNTATQSSNQTSLAGTGDSSWPLIFFGISGMTLSLAVILINSKRRRA